MGKKLLGERIIKSLKRKRFNLTKIQTEAVISELLEQVKQALIKGE